MSRVYVDNFGAQFSKQEIKGEFRTHGVIRRIWVARKLPGYAFINFNTHRDAQDAICDMNGKHNWWVELSHYYRGDGDRSGRDSGEFDSGNDYHCRRTHPSDHMSLSEHPCLSTTLAQTSTPMSCLKSSMSNT